MQMNTLSHRRRSAAVDRDDGGETMQHDSSRGFSQQHDSPARDRRQQQEQFNSHHHNQHPHHQHHQSDTSEVFDHAERIASSTAEEEEKEIKEESESIFSEAYYDMDPYVPFPEEHHLPEEENVLTIRAVFIGCLLGGLVNASNVYLGLWIFSFSSFVPFMGGF